MANHIAHLLAFWEKRRDDADWVLGTVYKTEGPCYRKAGAMMLFNSLGQQFGLLSGGCLESDIQKYASRVMQSGKAITLCYDGSDEDDLSFQLGIGCGGTVYILLQPITQANSYLCLPEIQQALQRRRSGMYFQRISGQTGEVQARFEAHNQISLVSKTAILTKRDHQDWLATPVRPQTHLLVCGGGVDAQPLVALGHELGWEISLWDPRPANARREYFLNAGRILRCGADELGHYITAQRVEAAVLMTHNVGLDAAALRSIQNTSLLYLAVLGPVSRLEKVLSAANLTFGELSIPVAGPAGLDLGAELPEGIALSILSECHARIMHSSALSLSGQTPHSKKERESAILNPVIQPKRLSQSA